MKEIFNDTIFDITQLIGVFPKQKLKAFLEKKHGIYGVSTSRGLVRGEHIVGTEPLLKEIFTYFYPNDFIVIDDLYAICTNAAIERRCHFSFVPYQVRVFSNKKSSGGKRKSIRLKGKRIYIDDSDKLNIHLPNPTSFLRSIGAKRVKLPKNLQKGDIYLVYDQRNRPTTQPGVKIVYFQDIAHRIPG